MSRELARRPLALAAAALVVVIVAFVALATFGADPAPADGGNNVAVAVNTKDGTTRFTVRLQIRRDDGSVVDSANAAVAYASCTDCRAIAAAFQIVLVTSEATEITPTNLALALNEGCSGCETLASAYQFVYGVDDQVRFTGAGRQEIHEIRKALKALRDPALSLAEIQAQLDELAVRLARVLTTELVVGTRQIESVPPPPEDTPVADPATGDTCEAAPTPVPSSSVLSSSPSSTVPDPTPASTTEPVCPPTSSTTPGSTSPPTTRPEETQAPAPSTTVPSASTTTTTTSPPTTTSTVPPRS